MTSLFPPRESLVSDILAGDGNIEKLFYGVHTYLEKHSLLVSQMHLLLQVSNNKLDNYAMFAQERHSLTT
jgi:hypothetical protein